MGIWRQPYRFPRVPRRRDVSALTSAGGAPQTLTPDTVTTTWATLTPTVTVGAVTVTPALVSTTWAAITPTVSVGAVSLTPDTVTTTWAALTPTITVIVTVDTVSTTWDALTPSVSTGAVTVTADTVTTVWDALTPTASVPSTTTTQGTEVTGGSNEGGTQARSPLPAAPRTGDVYELAGASRPLAFVATASAALLVASEVRSQPLTFSAQAVISARLAAGGSSVRLSYDNSARAVLNTDANDAALLGLVEELV